ncbi:uncharacterized protein N7443_008539 [Penicillium atrosanguineum]|uniref:Uncharacterized protein n=1 Tax=Penicillium atrosanguineum TaxID=1132637 RepID=A0A9W9U2M3_9EURO|nr:uncharacterized protein N7443_008539 [Penicillium atrosanguineum]KAJ5125469.1 hypothetical protein N7526_007646 [Penicillium atrosanguineum]KAJ5292586.1 hypothetical protein N7443_008539 [Penicillium atrosanguineum]KAJ5303390.1 hypothetical protein N7476_010189 [Penicillium atrosanguineum]
MGCYGLQSVQIMRYRLVERRICLPDLDVGPVADATPLIIQVLSSRAAKVRGSVLPGVKNVWSEAGNPTPAWT